LLSGTKLGVLIDEFLPVPTFEGLRVPVRVLATDVDTGDPVVLSEGDVRDAVRASCSFPGVFPPMVVNGRRLYDGGISEVIPVRLAREMAEETGVVVAVDVNSGTRWPAADSFVALALRAGLTLLRGRTRSELQGADLVIAPAMGDSGWMRPRKIPSFFAAGEEALTKALPELRRLLEG
jgi:NTE family protein